MMPKKPRFFHKLALAMVALMALVIVFSSTFRGMVHPRVTVARVNSGTIRLRYTREDVRIDPACLARQALPLSALEAVSVRETLKAPGMRVRKGEALLLLDGEEAESAYFAAKQAHTAAKLALEEFDAGYEAAVEAAGKALDSAESALDRLQFAPEERRAEAEKTLEKAKSDYDRLARDGIWQHTTRDVLEHEYEQAAQRYEAWSTLRDQDWRVLAEESGTIIYLMDMLPCDAAILPEGKEIRLSITAPENDLEGIYSGQEAELVIGEDPDDTQIITVSSDGREAGKITLSFQFVPMKPGVFSAGGEYAITFDSFWYSALIPASALVGDDMIWVADPVRNGSKTSYVAQRRTINRASGNAQVIPSNSWLGDTLVITQWDKPLTDGKTVLILGDVP